MAQATPVGLPFSLLCESGQVYAAALAGPGVNSVVTLNPSGSNTPAWIIGSDNRIYYGSSIGPYCLDAFFPGWGTGGNTSRSGSFVFLNTVVPGSVTQLWQWEQNGTMWYISNTGLNNAYPQLGWLWLNNDGGGSGPNQHLQLYGYGYGNNPGGDGNSCWYKNSPQS
jgi:hypothetical protein